MEAINASNTIFTIGASITVAYVTGDLTDHHAMKTYWRMEV
jgi:hypothetical protein